MEKFLTIVAVLSGLCTFGTFCGMLYAFKKFLDKPRDDIRDEVIALKTEVQLLKTRSERDKEDIYNRLEKGNRRFDEQDRTNEVILHSTLALIEFEIQYCLTQNIPISTDLDKVKQELHTFLSRR